jgi:hypothetical protein
MLGSDTVPAVRGSPGLTSHRHRARIDGPPHIDATRNNGSPLATARRQPPRRPPPGAKEEG